ncbi:MAG: adenylate/guanylate cyclase domain-containing protein [Xanthobacteraceae bacterium]
MSDEGVERRLAAVLAADVAGYSRLMGIDEEGTLARLKALRKAFVDPTIAAHRGRIVKTTGDGMLIEFASAVDAVRSAVEFQRRMAEQNAAVPLDQRIEFRIGIHIGDIIFDDNDIFGDGVNIAARLEGISEPGGVCISDDAQRQIRAKVDVAFHDMGPQTLKNIAEPMRAWSARPDGDGPSPANRSTSPIQSLALPDKPSIAVLPFQNMSGDPEQEYFADGMVEDIVTALSRFTSLFVIARNSSFTYKGRAVDIKQVGRELGVRYVLEGSVRKAAGRLRISGQLIDASTGAHLWAEKFDGALEDMFELQDAVTERVVGAIEPSVKQAEINRARAKPTSNLDAYDYYLRAFQQMTLYTREGSDAALDNIRQAIALDPGYALAKAYLSVIYMLRWIQGWGATGDPEKGLAAAREAIVLGSDDPSVLRWAGHTLGFWGDYDRSIALLEKAARLNVNGSQILASLGWMKVYACTDTERAIAHFERSIRLSPRDPEMASTLTGIAFAHLIAGHNEQALAFAQQSIDEGPQFTSGHRAKITALIFLNREQEARAAAEMLLTFDPQFTISSRLAGYRKSDFQQRYHAALKAAGLRE